MEHKKRWLWAPVLAMGLAATAVGCSQSDGTPGTTPRPIVSTADSAAVQVSWPHEPSPAPSGSTAGTSTRQASGLVVEIDLRLKTLVVKSDEGEMVFAVRDRLTRDLEDLDPGEEVTILYTQDAGKNTAEAIHGG
jgi:hypothetical protein